MATVIAVTVDLESERLDDVAQDTIEVPSDIGWSDFELMVSTRSGATLEFVTVPSSIKYEVVSYVARCMSVGCVRISANYRFTTIRLV